MDKLTQNVVNALLEWGADLVGVAPVERFANAPEGHRPTDFMPECKSVISVAIHIFKGMADVWGEYDEPGKTITPYLFYGYGLTNLESSRMVNRMAKLLEYQGYKTLCFMPTWVSSFYKYFEETVETNKVKAEFSHRHAAAAAGIGTLGWNGLGLTPEFGSMQRYNSILTSAELEPTPLYDGPDLCRKEECGNKCARICPAKAFSETESQSLTIEDKTISGILENKLICCFRFESCRIEGPEISAGIGPLTNNVIIPDFQTGRIRERFLEGDFHEDAIVVHRGKQMHDGAGIPIRVLRRRRDFHDGAPVMQNNDDGRYDERNNSR